MFTLLDKQMEKKTAMISVFLCTSVWGLLWIPLRMIESFGLQSLWANTFFILMPIPLLMAVSGRTLIQDRAHYGLYFWAGLTVGLGFMFYTLGLLVGSVTKTTLLFYLTPLWSSILGILFLGERGRPVLWLAHGLGLLGLALIMNLNVFDLQLDPTDIWGFLSGIFWSIGSVLVRRYPKANYLALNLSHYSFAVLVGLIGVLIMGLPVPDVSSMAKALPVGIIASCLIFLPAMLLIFRVTQYISPAVVGILMLSEVFCAVISASIFLGETMVWFQWIGAGFIIITAVIVTLTEGEKI